MPVTPVGRCDIDVNTGRRVFTISAQAPWTKPRGRPRPTKQIPGGDEKQTTNEVDRLSVDVPDRE